MSPASGMVVIVIIPSRSGVTQLIVIGSPSSYPVNGNTAIPCELVYLVLDTSFPFFS